MRTIRQFSLNNTNEFSIKLLQWAQQFDQISWLDSNKYPQKYSRYDAILAVDAARNLNCQSNGAFSELKQWQEELKDFSFGYLSYDLKNDTETLNSELEDRLHFPDLHFFQPKKLFFLSNDTLELQYLTSVGDEMEDDLKAINKIDLTKAMDSTSFEPVKIKKKIQKSAYLQQLDKVLAHIHRGDIYEINFCQEFYAEEAEINPLRVYHQLNAISNPPFANFTRLDHHYILCASPERFLQKKANKIISQPIKGTAKRLKNKQADLEIAMALERDEKERAENIMIVDLVRNDLSKIALKGSVTVDELCKVYTFDQVHQLISTVSAEVGDQHGPVDIIKALFPMGSMTGAPKLSAMKLIEKYEASKRGVYSGAIGYFTPDGDFDFNVVIRSILYNEKRRYLSYSVGGAITAKSIPEKEYEECLLKAIAMKKALAGG